MAVMRPKDMNGAFAEAVNSGDLEQVLALYEPDAVLAPRPGERARGLGEIRAALHELLSLGGEMESRNVWCIQAGELALLRGEWRLRGWVVVGCLAAAGATASASAADTNPVVLRIVFPEGWSARQMADRVAEVRRIAIERRGVTPRLTGAAYEQATRRARPPQAFRAEAGGSVEGSLFPALYQFEADTGAETLVANQLMIKCVFH